MQIKTIEYSRVFNLGGCENKKVGVICEVGDEFAEQAMKQAIEFVESYDPKSMKQKQDKIDKEFRESLSRIIEHLEEYGEDEAIEAIKTVRKLRTDDLPF